MNKFFGHLKTVLTHKYYVMKFCFMCGLYKQGLLHDMSKFSPVEFFESVKYWSGTRSPIDACKEANGVSMCWLHHRSHNKHHWEYWCDNFESGIMGQKIPFKYVLEMFCDFLAAGVTYGGGFVNFSLTEDYEWWQEKRKRVKMHKDTMLLIDVLYTSIMANGSPYHDMQDIENVLGYKDYIRRYQEMYEHDQEGLERIYSQNLYNMNHKKRQCG